jgi:zinc and cadmium transporter
MNTLTWIVASGALMAVIALIGSVTLLVGERIVRRCLLPLVALAAGTLIGGAFFHLIPTALDQFERQANVWLVVIAGFAIFLALEQLLHWHHAHSVGDSGKQPMTYLILIGDGVHNFIDGAAIGATFLVDVRAGVATTIAAAMHEIPQELGDFAVLVHGGWSKRHALIANMLSSLTFLCGGLTTYLLSGAVDATLLVPLAAGTFLYVGASDLVPEVNKASGLAGNVMHFAMFVVGVALMYVVSLVG